MTVVLRIGLAVLAAQMLMLGFWNQFWPRGFYDSFPTVDLLPPFSEHFARDFGGTSLGLGVVLTCAAVLPRTVLVVPALLGNWAWALPHFVFHMTELGHESASDVAFLIVSTGSAAVLPPVLLAIALVRMRRDRRSSLHHPAVG